MRIILTTCECCDVRSRHRALALEWFRRLVVGTRPPLAPKALGLPEGHGRNQPRGPSLLRRTAWRRSPCWRGGGSKRPVGGAMARVQPIGTVRGPRCL